MRKVIYIGFLMWFGSLLFAQELSTLIEKPLMSLGGRNTIVVTHNGLLNESNLTNFTSIGAQTASESAEPQKVEIEVVEFEFNEIELRLIITAWDSGKFIIPPFYLDKNEGISSQTLMFEVEFPQVDENGDIADIYEVLVDTEEDFSSRFWWLLDLILLIVFVVGLFLILKMDQVDNVQNDAVYLSPDQSALQELELLLSKKLFQNDLQKMHFVEFSDIIRKYIAARFEFVTFEKTSAQIIQEMHKLRVENRIVQRLNSLLHLADLVKFSKATTNEQEILKSSNELRELIAETTNFYVLNKQAEEQEKGAQDV